MNNEVLNKVDDSLLVSGSISFSAGDNLTTEKKTGSVSLLNKKMDADQKFLLAIDKPTEDTAGDMTVSLYNEIKVDGTNSRDCLLATLVVEKIASAATYRCFLVQGLGTGEGAIKIGMEFATDSGAIEPHYKLYRI